MVEIHNPLNGRLVPVIIGTMLSISIAVSGYAARQYSSVLDGVVAAERKINAHIDSLEESELQRELLLVKAITRLDGLDRAHAEDKVEFQIFRGSVTEVLLKHIQDHPPGTP